MRTALYLAFAVLALGGCRAEPARPAQAREMDPAIAAALNDPIMVDPDLVSQNHGNAAIVVGGFEGVPRFEDSPAPLSSPRESPRRP